MLAPIDRGAPKGLPKPGPLPKLDPAAADELVFKFQDKNKDGALSKDEFVRGGSKLDKLMGRMKHASYDADGDGKVDLKEFKAGRARERKMDEWGTGMPNLPGGLKGMTPLAEQAIPPIRQFFKSLFK